MFKCSVCGTDVTREGKCFLCVSIEVRLKAESFLGNPRCNICGKHLDDTAVTRFWYAKGKLVEARIHESCCRIASFKKTYSVNKPRSYSSVNKPIMTLNRETDGMARIHAERARRPFMYMQKGSIGGFMFGKLTKVYKQAANEMRKREQTVMEVTTQVNRNGKLEKLDIAWSDSATVIETEGLLTGPTGIVGKYIFVLCYGVNEGGYNKVAVFADTSGEELLKEVKESEEYHELCANNPNYSIGPFTWFDGIEAIVEKHFSGEEKKSDDIPF